MFQLAAFATLALSAASSVSALVVPRTTAPAGWATKYLESYDTYHIRYLAIGCAAKHGSAFFDACCHPLLANEVLEKARPAQCIPSAAASSSASAVNPTSTVTTPVSDVPEDGDEDCEEDDGEDEVTTHAPVTSTHAPAVTSKAAPTTTQAAAPTKAATTKAAATSSVPQQAVVHTTSPAKPASTPASSSSVNSGGFATFFFQNGVAGACGTVHKDSDMIAAIDADRYGNTGQRSSLCGKQVQITNTKNGKSVTVTIADACPTCENSNSIDLSQSAFNKIATPEEGMVPITWSFL
ncbi:RlpA-like double-psi beta-barrel-protein domain-containing protein-containing protein [Crucibulum laeve]|uniref:RlpA-like double-psi beta-barrel-protein domain-containing protein-containing protein n=1 Tax=Crucibulum laeve TaxID=68775 RepID=A0A5C3MB41_9AGAR|nr:RlpA-like double-psi beta-barrel-protein domain-containing protein-containing protein [Crucibulum laeve]